MKPVSDELMAEWETAARNSLKEIQKFFAYQGDNRDYERKARSAAVVIGGYARMRASETNRLAVTLAAERMGHAGLLSE